MARNGSGVYSLPAGSTVTNGDTSDATDVNTPLADIATDLNTARPIVAGGTGATSASAAQTNLGLAIGTDVQAYDSDLTAWAALGSVGAGIVDIGTLNTEANALLRHVLTTQGTGAGNVTQGFAVDPFAQELYTTHVTGSPEKVVVNKFSASGDRTQTSARYNSTETADLGHQGLAVSWDKDGTRWFWCSANEADTDYEDKILRFQIADGSGTELTISNVQEFTVFSGVGNGYVTPCVSLDGKWLVCENSAGGVATTIRIFDLHAMMDGGAGDYSSSYVHQFTTKDINGTTLPLQGMACDGAYIYIYAGDSSTATENTILVYSMSGTLQQEIDATVVGKTLALADDTGTDAYEPEGMGWIWLNGRPYLSVLICSGDSGSRVNRIWALGANLPSISYGDGNRPAFISVGTNDYAVPDGEVMRFGHYDAESDTFTERASISAAGQADFTAVNGTWTATIYDDASAGNASATTATCQYVDLGGMVWLNVSFSAVDVTGMTGANNAYIRGHGFTPAESARFDGLVMSGFDLTTNAYQVAAEMQSDGNIVIREMADSGVDIGGGAGVNVIANVSQINGAVIRLSGWFRKS